MSAQTSIAEPEVGSPVAAAAQAQEDSSIAAATASTIVQAIVEAGEFASLPPPNVVVRDEGESSSELEDDYDQLHVEEFLDTSLHVKANVEALLRKLLLPQRVLLQDKVTYVLFFFNLLLCSYLLGYSPQRFYRLYTVEAGALLVVRFITYKWSLQHYYLLDWCYVSNALLVGWIYCFPRSVMLFKICFAHAMGPLLWSILAFRNSIVPHSLDKMTSHFMHWYPACVCWASRWHPTDEMAAHLKSNPAERKRWESAGVVDLVVLPLLPYLLWATFYYLKVFVVSSKKIQERGYATLFNFSTASRRSLFGAVVLRAPLKLRPLVYMAVHVLLTSLTMLANLIWFQSYWATTTFLVCILAASLWSGANYYEYLAKKGLQRRAGSILSSGTQQPSQSVTVDSKKRS